MDVKNILFALIMMTSATPVCAQKFKLIQATDMVWAGGIAGRHGINYSFELECSKFKKEPTPDLIWIKGIPYKIDANWQNERASVQVNRTKEGGVVHYTINIGLSYNDQRDYMQPGGDAQTDGGPNPPRKYKGLAVIRYKSRGRTKYFEISNITQHLPGVNYP